MSHAPLEGYHRTTTIMTPDFALELSLEQLVNELDKKLFGEYARMRSTMPTASRTFVAAFTAEVRFQEQNGKTQISTGYFAGRCPRETGQRDFRASPLFEEFGTTREPSTP